MDDGKDKADDEAKRIPLLEWICAALGLLIVLPLIGFTASNAINQDHSPPDVVTEILDQRKVANGYLVRVRAENKGGTAAAGVTIRGSLEDGEKELEESDFTFDYLPSHSESEGGLFFSIDPRGKDLKVRAMGYQMP